MAGDDRFTPVLPEEDPVRWKRHCGPWLLGIFAGFVLGFMVRQSQATVRPVLLDSGQPLVDTAEPYRVEPYLQEIEFTETVGFYTEVVPKTVLSQLCGDKDGCQIRLIAAANTGPAPDRLYGGHLIMDSTAEHWYFVPLTGDFKYGSVSDAEERTFISLLSGSDHYCSFREYNPFDSYQLNVSAGTPQIGETTQCRLRIED